MIHLVMVEDEPDMCCRDVPLPPKSFDRAHDAHILVLTVKVVIYVMTSTDP